MIFVSTILTKYSQWDRYTEKFDTIFEPNLRHKKVYDSIFIYYTKRDKSIAKVCIIDMVHEVTGIRKCTIGTNWPSTLAGANGNNTKWRWSR
jgi:hypothetical protein